MADHILKCKTNYGAFGLSKYAFGFFCKKISQAKFFIKKLCLPRSAINPAHEM